MVEVDKIRLDILSLFLQAVPGIVAYLSAVEAGVTCISCSLSHSALVSSLMPPPLTASSPPVVWCVASGQVHWHRGVIHGWWGIGRVVLWSSSSSLSSWGSSPVILREGASLVATIDPLICHSSSLCPNVLLMQQPINDSFPLCKGSYLVFQGVICKWGWWFKYVI